MSVCVCTYRDLLVPRAFWRVAQQLAVRDDGGHARNGHQRPPVRVGHILISALPLPHGVLMLSKKTKPTLVDMSLSMFAMSFQPTGQMLGFLAQVHSTKMLRRLRGSRTKAATLSSSKRIPAKHSADA